MLQNTFLSQGNLRMLWDVIMENEKIQKNRQAAAKLFNQTTPSFVTQNDEASRASNLTELNKAFLSFMTKNLGNYSEKKELVTHEDLQGEKQSLFQRDLEIKQKEFENSMSLSVPETPNFKDNVKDEPISEMEFIIKKTLQERNFEIEQIERNQVKDTASTEWLNLENKPQEKPQKIKKLTKTDLLGSKNGVVESHKLLSKLKINSKELSIPDVNSINTRLDKLEALLFEIHDIIKKN